MNENWGQYTLGIRRMSFVISKEWNKTDHAKKSLEIQKFSRLFEKVAEDLKKSLKFQIFS